MNKISVAEFDALTRRDPYLFLQRVFAEVRSNREFEDAAFLELIVAMLEAVRRGEIKRLIINLPPRGLKSVAVSVAFVAWVLGHDPTIRFVVVSYGQELSDKLARDTLQVMQSPWYRRLFPKTKLSTKRQAVHEFETTKGGGRIGTSMTGAITGFGADIIIIDDPLKADEASSETARKKVNELIGNTLASRFDDPGKGVVIGVMQRLHQEDLTGFLLPSGVWKHVSLPVIAETDEVYPVQTPFGPWTFRRKAGELLHPKRWSMETLEQRKAELGGYNFAAQYMQRPAPAGGGVIQTKWLLPYDTLPGKPDYVLQSWDTASKPGEGNDFCVGTTWAIFGKHAYLTNLIRKQCELPELKRLVRQSAELASADLVVIEDAASGIALIQELRSEGLHQVREHKPIKDKVSRARNETIMMENGCVHVPAAAPWRDELYAELEMFPAGTHDDIVDSVTQALAFIRERGYEPDSFRHMRGFYEAELKALVKPDEPIYRLMPPQLTSALHLIDGRLAVRHPDGSFDVPGEAQANGLKSRGWKNAN